MPKLNPRKSIIINFLLIDFPIFVYHMFISISIVKLNFQNIDLKKIIGKPLKIAAFLSFCFFVFSINDSFSQKEAHNWYFGSYAGITFNTDPPFCTFRWSNVSMTMVVLHFLTNRGIFCFIPMVIKFGMPIIK